MKLSIKINFVLLLVFALFIGAGIIVNDQYTRIQSKREFENRTNALIKSSRTDAEEIIANLILQQDAGVELYIKRVEKKERLNGMSLMTDDEYRAEIKGLQCLDGYIKNGICITEREGMYTLYKQLQYGNSDFGYLKKEYIVKPEGVLTSSQLVKLVLVIIPLLLTTFAIISWLLKRIVVKPLNAICTSIQPLKTGNFQIHIPAQKTDELKHLSNNIKTIVRELEHYQEETTRNVNLVSIGRISAMIAHDIRSPLSVLKGYVRTPAPSEDPEMREYQQAAQRSVDKLLHMADDLVDYAKASKIERAQQDVNKLISKDVVAATQERAKKHGVNISCDISDKITANIDAYRMERVLVNLINNAIEATSKEGVVIIKAQAKGTHNEKCDLIISVADKGRGIADEDLAHVFNSFFTKGKRSGTGLGLSYCKQVVEAHGGTIDVESEIGKGTTFRIRIPECAVKAEVKTEIDDKVFRNEPELKCDGRKFILIDDDADIRLRWRKIVHDNGGRVIGEATSYENMTSNDGLNYHEVDVAIVDYEFEGSAKNGIEVISYLRTKGIKEIHLCTGFADNDEVRTAAFAAGADSVMPKEMG